MVFNTTFNNISVISRRNFVYVNDLLKLNLKYQLWYVFVLRVMVFNQQILRI